MKREPRGFHYELEPLSCKCEWELQDLRQALAKLNKETDEKNRIVGEYEQRLAAASTDLMAQRDQSQIMHADKQLIAHAYMAQQLQQLAVARHVLAQLEKKRDETIQHLHKLQKFADGLTEHRTEQVKHYAQIIEKANVVEADDAWLRNIPWKAAQ